ncbi:MAG TPA: glutathione S-transferase family protein [Lautropia sp.]|nr:glutathione S-transferase family protein [Lautropia sp.]
MKDKIVFYHNPQSRAAIAHWMLEEVGADYEIRHIDFEKGDNRTPEFLAINPMGKIPTIVVGGTVITEAPAIIAWLADAYPAADLAPPVGSRERGTYYRWLFFGGSCIEPAISDQMFKRPAPERSGALGWGSYADVIRTIETALRPGPYLLGEKFCAADVYIGAELSWAGQFGAPQINESQVIKEYVERCRKRPAFLKTRS